MIQKAGSNHLHLFSILFVLFNLCSCSDSGTEDFNSIATKSPYDFHCIERYQGKLYASGGDVWNKSILASSNNGSDWTIDSLTDKSIFDLYTDGQALFGVGNEGYILSFQPNLELTRTQFWRMLRAFTSVDNEFIAVGGKNFNKGWIFKLNSNLETDTTHFFDNEILAVSCNDSGTCIASGYGVILTSNDAANSWQRSDETGDYYNSIAVNNKEEFFIVGYNGTIIKSKDNGSSWEKIKDGHSPLANNKPFRTIKFQGDTGIIVGDNGLIWISQDSGENWNDISIETDSDLFDFTFFQSKIICVSEAGQIFNIEI